MTAQNDWHRAAQDIDSIDSVVQGCVEAGCGRGRDHPGRHYRPGMARQAALRRIDQLERRRSAGATLSHNFAEMVRLGKTLPTHRLQRMTSQVEAAAAWERQRGCSRQAAGERAAELFTRDRISIVTADVWCIALGTHLAVVYPEVYHTPKPWNDVPLLEDA